MRTMQFNLKIMSDISDQNSNQRYNSSIQNEEQPRRYRQFRKIYEPGSGPLRKSDNFGKPFVNEFQFGSKFKPKHSTDREIQVNNYHEKKHSYHEDNPTDSIRSEDTRYGTRNLKRRDNEHSSSVTATRGHYYDKVNFSTDLPPRFRKLQQNHTTYYYSQNRQHYQNNQQHQRQHHQRPQYRQSKNYSYQKSERAELPDTNESNTDENLCAAKEEVTDENNDVKDLNVESDTQTDSDNKNEVKLDFSKLTIFDWNEEVAKEEKILAKSSSPNEVNRSDQVELPKRNEFEESMSPEPCKKSNMIKTGATSESETNDKKTSLQWSSSRDSSRDRSRKSSVAESDNWRDEIRRNEERKRNLDFKIKSHAPGILFLSQQNKAFENDTSQQFNFKSTYDNRKLYDPKNSNNNRTNYTKTQQYVQPRLYVNKPIDSNYALDPKNFTNPQWFDPNSNSFNNCKHQNEIIETFNLHTKITWILTNGLLFTEWENFLVLHDLLKSKLHNLLLEDLKFSETENIELHFWKLLYYNVIEFLRNLLSASVPNSEEKSNLKSYALHLIEDGLTFFNNMITILENKFEFCLKDILETELCLHKKYPGYTGLALNSVQKMCLFLGDLTRYREQVNETSEINKSKIWYLKAQHINPKNGKSYNQLAILAYHEKRKFDAIYFYARSLMSSNPIISARESLKSLFDETKRKYEMDEKQRLKSENDKLKSANRNSCYELKSKLRREVWIHPEHGRRTSTLRTNGNNYEEEQLRSLSHFDLLAKFNVSFLHAHGKIFTKIGIDTFYETTIRMLNEFHVLLDQYLHEIPELRLLKLMALNMFAIENSQLKDCQQEDDGYRSELQEKALILSLQMFNIMLDKCINLFQDNSKEVLMSNSLQQLLLAIKIWCDWMLCHTSIWNPPPSISEYQVLCGSESVWSRLATLMNILEKFDCFCDENLVSKEQCDGFVPICLTEDSVLAGFTPLMYNIPEIYYTSATSNKIEAETFLRVKKLIFFGTIFLCGVDPQVLKLQKSADNQNEYVSVVCHSPMSEDGPQLYQQYFIESISNLEDVEHCYSNNNLDNLSENSDHTDSEMKQLLNLKKQLEKQKKRQQKVKEILNKSVISVEIEVRPKFIVPDTNCFIDYLTELEDFCKSLNLHQYYPYTLIVPIVVLNELEGLSRGKMSSARLKNVSENHLLKVSTCAKNALNFLRSKNSSIRCLTAKGTTLSSLTFTAENDESLDHSVERNDDRILTACLNLCRREQPTQPASSGNETKKLIREVVLLTEDRNLKFKALSRNLPVRELQDFMKWAG